MAGLLAAAATTSTPDYENLRWLIRSSRTVLQILAWENNFYQIISSTIGVLELYRQLK